MQQFLVRVLFLASNLPLRPLTVFTFESYIFTFCFFSTLSVDQPPRGMKSQYCYLTDGGGFLFLFAAGRKARASLFKYKQYFYSA